jgi:16S rRNA (uracil1498-N3)-methyltransferase
LADAGKAQAQLRVLKTEETLPPACRITLLQALPKGKLMESIIQKAVELGVSGIVPLMTERVVKHFDTDSADAARDKWRQVAIEAIKQCGALWLPEIVGPQTPAQYLAASPATELALVGSLRATRKHPHGHFEAFFEAHGRMPASASLWIGPEGDFTDAELEAILAAGTLPITMGDLVLRTETAATYGLSVIQYELQRPRRPA